MKLKLISLSIFCAYCSFAQAEKYQDPTFDAVDFYDDFYGSEGMVEIATGVKTQIYKAPAVASVFTAAQIKNMGATDIDDVLETVPGLHISRNGNNYNPVYSFRGVYSTYNAQVLMLVNGIPITNNFVGNRSQNWGGMPVEAIARIEIIRGPGSAIYGADAFSGVINIVTKNADDINKNEVAVRAGSNSTSDAWLTFAGKQDDLKYSAVVEYHKTKGANNLIEADGQTVLDNIFGTNVSKAPGTLNLATENLDFRGEVNYHGLTIRTGYQLRDNLESGAGLAEVLDPGAKQKSVRFNFDINYQKQLNDTLTLNVQSAYFNTSAEIKTNYYIYPKGADLGHGLPYTGGFIGNPEVWEKHRRLNLALDYSGIDKHAFRIGAGLYKGDLYRTRETKNFGFNADGNVIIPGDPVQDVSDSPYVFLKETDRINRYLFVQDIWNIANDWELTAGVRYDDYSDFGSTTNPRLALVWSTSLNLSTKLLYGRAFRAPSFAERGNINNPTALGNPNIQPESIETTELVFDYHPGSGFGAIANFYHYEWDDIIQFVPDTGETSSTAQNFGKQVAYGTELEVNWQLTEQLKLAANYAWSKATNKSNDVDVAFVPEQQWYLQLDWKINEQLKLNIKNHLVQDRIRNQGDLRSNIDDYWLTDLTVRWTPSKQPFELALIAKNIFDQDVREPSINNGAVVNIPNDLPQPGSMFLGEVRYHF
ncbi:TonB-dependent receptor plug domain-containing protein [Thalassotalea agariperforans]